MGGFANLKQRILSIMAAATGLLSGFATAKDENSQPVTLYTSPANADYGVEGITASVYSDSQYNIGDKILFQAGDVSETATVVYKFKQKAPKDALKKGTSEIITLNGGYAHLKSNFNAQPAVVKLNNIVALNAGEAINPAPVADVIPVPGPDAEPVPAPEVAPAPVAEAPPTQAVEVKPVPLPTAEDAVTQPVKEVAPVAETPTPTPWQLEWENIQKQARIDAAEIERNSAAKPMEKTSPKLESLESAQKPQDLTSNGFPSIILVLASLVFSSVSFLRKYVSFVDDMYPKTTLEQPKPANPLQMAWKEQFEKFKQELIANAEDKKKESAQVEAKETPKTPPGNSLKSQILKLMANVFGLNSQAPITPWESSTDEPKAARRPVKGPLKIITGPALPGRRPEIMIKPPREITEDSIVVLNRDSSSEIKPEGMPNQVAKLKESRNQALTKTWTRT